MSWKKRLLAGIIAGMLVGRMLLPPSAPAQQEPLDWDAWKSEFFEPFGLVVRQIQIRYVDKVDPEKLFASACYGMLSQLDEYSSYIPEERLEEFEGDTKGEFGGLGIQITYNPIDRVLKVEQPIPGTPAFEAGVLAEDIITHIHELATDKHYDPREFRDVHDAVRVLRGQPKTQVLIHVRHAGTGEDQEITITREVITIPGVRGARMADEEYKIGYIYIAYFHERAVEDLRKAIQDLQAQGMKALIIDLRFNPGGLLTSAIDISDTFLTDRTIVSARGRASPSQVFRTRGEDMLNGVPLVVLVNRYSASASEIVAGAIKDNNRGLIIGETTYGKGSVQSILPFKDNKRAIKLTTARYYTPSDVCVDKTGIKPHIEVKLDDEASRRLALALLDESRKAAPEEQEPPGQPGATPAPAEKQGEQEPPFRDVQLERAVDVLKALLIGAQMNAPAAQAPIAAPAQ